MQSQFERDLIPKAQHIPGLEYFLALGNLYKKWHGCEKKKGTKYLPVVSKFNFKLEQL